MENYFIIGVDDAGRGPVIGPMVLAGVLIENKHSSKLGKWGAKDSKQLTAEKREEIAAKIIEDFEYHVEMASAEEIDARATVGSNLNKIEALKTARIINTLLKHIPETEKKIKIVVDCPSPNTEAWKNYLKQHLDRLEILQLIIEHKADVNHLACSAASIIAKTHRDAEIEKIKKEIGIDFGSGYCHDPVTCDFLEKHAHEFVDKGIIRTSWDTWTKVVAKKEQKSLKEF